MSKMKSKMKILSIYAVCLMALLLAAPVEAAASVCYVEQQPDTTVRDLGDLESKMQSMGLQAPVDTTNTLQNKQRNFNALRYTLDRRHRFAGDKFENRGFWRHWLLDLGGGMLQYARNGSYRFTPITDFHVHIGRQLSPMVTLRAGVSGGVSFASFGQPDIYTSTYSGKVGADLDLLYSLSNYLYGYRPERPFDFSLMMGVGMQYGRMMDQEGVVSTYATHSGTAANLHAGFQFKFFAGSHAALAIEPYVLLGSDGMDLTRNDVNWHRFDLGYGFNLSYIWYFTPMLSAERNAGLFKRRFQPGSRLFKEMAQSYTWRHPLFVDYGMGPAFLGNTSLSSSDATGYHVRVGLGWWMSSAIGLRAGLNITNANFTEDDAQTIYNKMGSETGSLDLLLNPFGFTRNYTWDEPVGINLFGGYKAGKLHIVDNGLNGLSHSRRLFGYRMGAQLWLRLTDDLRFNVEPTYSINEYREPHERHRYNEFNVKLGLTALLRTPRYRHWDATEEAALPLRGVFFGGGLGWNTTVHEWSYQDKHTSWLKNGELFAGYNFDEINGVRLSGSYITDAIWNEQGGNRQLLRHDFKTHLMTLDYQFNLLNFLSGYRPSRRWNVYLLAGGGIAASSGQADWAFDVSGQVSYRVARNLSLYYSHKLFFMPSSHYPSGQIYTAHGTVVNSLNVGLMYNFTNMAASLRKFIRSINGVPADSSRMPNGRFFLEYGYGYGDYPMLPSDASHSWGTALSGALGYWFTPYLGTRLSVNTSRGVAVQIPALDHNPDHVLNGNTALATGSLDLMFNPFAASRHSTWDDLYGMNFFVGYQLGRAAFWDASNKAEGKVNGIRLGTQLWMRLDKNLRFFIQPLYEQLYLNGLYYNPRNHSFAEDADNGGNSLKHYNAFSVRMGLSLSLDEHPSRGMKAQTVAPKQGIFAGIGGGWNFLLSKQAYDGNAARWNGLLYGGYNFDAYNGVRANIQYISDGIIDNKGYLKGKTQVVDGYSSRRLNVAIFSVNYQLDVMSLFAGYYGNRRWDANIYAGPAYARALKAGKDANSFPDYETQAHFGANGGLMLTYDFSRHLSGFFNHNIYLFGMGDYGYVFDSRMIIKKVTCINAFNIGLQYAF